VRYRWCRSCRNGGASAVSAANAVAAPAQQSPPAVNACSATPVVARYAVQRVRCQTPFGSSVLPSPAHHRMRSGHQHGNASATVGGVHQWWGNGSTLMVAAGQVVPCWYGLPGTECRQVSVVYVHGRTGIARFVALQQTVCSARTVSSITKPTVAKLLCLRLCASSSIEIVAAVQKKAVPLPIRNRNSYSRFWWWKYIPALETLIVSLLLLDIETCFAVIDNAKKGVKHIVHLGACGPDDTTIGHWAWHQFVERYIEWSGFFLLICDPKILCRIY
jgi:hypothetical protein